VESVGREITGAPGSVAAVSTLDRRIRLQRVGRCGFRKRRAFTDAAVVADAGGSVGDAVESTCRKDRDTPEHAQRRSRSVSHAITRRYQGRKRTE
jgi:hypothetical protein